jgi:hypothetical protein
MAAVAASADHRCRLQPPGPGPGVSLWGAPNRKEVAVPKTVGNGTSADMIMLRHEDAAGCCYDGRPYSSDENGDVLVPAEAACELFAHGFVPVPEVALTPSRRAKPLPGSRALKG